MPRPSGVALLLSRLGAHTSGRFADRLAELGLRPEHVAVLRTVGQRPGLSQQAVATQLGTLPSRVVRLVDELEAQGLVERRRSQVDRRLHELYTPDTARDRLAEVMATVVEHDAETTRGLTAAEKRTLAGLLAKMAAEQGLEGGGPP